MWEARRGRRGVWYWTEIHVGTSRQLKGGWYVETCSEQIIQQLEQWFFCSLLRATRFNNFLLHLVALRLVMVTSREMKGKKSWSLIDRNRSSERHWKIGKETLRWMKWRKILWRERHGWFSNDKGGMCPSFSGQLKNNVQKCPWSLCLDKIACITHECFPAFRYYRSANNEEETCNKNILKYWIKPYHGDICAMFLMGQNYLQSVTWCMNIMHTSREVSGARLQMAVRVRNKKCCSFNIIVQITVIGFIDYMSQIQPIWWKKCRLIRNYLDSTEQIFDEGKVHNDNSNWQKCEPYLVVSSIFYRNYLVWGAVTFQKSFLI